MFKTCKVDQNLQGSCLESTYSREAARCERENVLNKFLKQGPKESFGKTNTVLIGYLTGLGYGKLSGVL